MASEYAFIKAIAPRPVPPVAANQTHQGGNLTFGDNYRFTEHLRDMVAKELPKINVKVLVYPKYETRGDLGDCVMRFRTW